MSLEILRKKYLQREKAYKQKVIIWEKKRKMDDDLACLINHEILEEKITKKILYKL